MVFEPRTPFVFVCTFDALFALCLTSLEKFTVRVCFRASSSTVVSLVALSKLALIFHLPSTSGAAFAPVVLRLKEHCKCLRSICLFVSLLMNATLPVASPRIMAPAAPKKQTRSQTAPKVAVNSHEAPKIGLNYAKTTKGTGASTSKDSQDEGTDLLLDAADEDVADEEEPAALRKTASKKPTPYKTALPEKIVFQKLASKSHVVNQRYVAVT